MHVRVTFWSDFDKMIGMIGKNKYHNAILIFLKLNLDYTFDPW